MSIIKSSDEHLTLNADGSGKSVKFQANGVEKASISSAGVMTATSFAGSGANLTNLPVADDSITLAKLASGTDGNLISYDASGNPVAVATGSDGQVLTSTGAGSPPVFETLPAGGLSEADTWYLDTEFSINGTNTSDLTNLSRTGSVMGTGMTESGGVLTFPSTGHWLVIFEMSYRVYTTVRYMYGYIKQSTDSGSSWGDVMNNAGNALYSNSVVYGSHNMSAIIDVTNASTHRVKFSVFANTGSSTDKIHSGVGTSMKFIKLGAT